MLLQASPEILDLGPSKSVGERVSINSTHKFFQLTTNSPSLPAYTSDIAPARLHEFMRRVS
jgi:hypothetical protein